MSVGRGTKGRVPRMFVMDSKTTESASRRVQVMRTRLDEMLAEFNAGDTVEPDAYQRSMNDLCKALLDLEATKS